jgi:soluble lytic murein transglycosylase
MKLVPFFRGLLAAGCVSLCVSVLQAAVETIALSLSEPLTSASPAVSKLKDMRNAFESGKVDACLAQGKKLKKAAKSLEPWILALELECATKLPLQKASGDRLAAILNGVDSKSQWMAFGPWAPRLRSVWVKARLWAIEVDSKFNRTRAWQNVEKLSAILPSAIGGGAPMDDAARAKLWRMAGELMFLSQKTEGAREFFRRSLAEQDQPDLRDRMRLLGSGVPEANSTPPLPATVKTPDGSAAENDLADRISNTLKAGDLVAAAADSMKLIHDYPGSPRAKWAADRTQESLISVAEKSNEKFLPVRESLLKLMEKSDPDRMAEWARVLFNRGLWTESARLGKVASEKQGGGRSTKTLELAMDAAYAIDDFKTVKSLGEELVEKHAGTASARTAALRLGLLAYRLQNFEQASALFEKLVATTSTESLEIQARYWLWRSLEKIKSERAKNEGEELARRFPFSYYGLRARIEGRSGELDWSKENPNMDPKTDKIESKIWVTQEEKQSFDRGMLLASAGWFDEAQTELATLPEATTPDSRAVRARVWAAAKNFLAASRLANDAWDAKFELRRPELFEVVWPPEYRDTFESAARAKNIDGLMCRSLAKQESGYNKRAVSSSGAMGLMQMIPATAREIADDLRMGKLNLPDDMFEPERNIKMGTYYIGKMLNQFKGHVPLALAAYNAGPTRLDRWLKSRPSLQGLEATRTSLAENEIWMDEFPFAETSGYVKSILRNMLVYQMVESGRIVSQEPLWKSNTSVSRP